MAIIDYKPTTSLSRLSMEYDNFDKWLWDDIATYYVQGEGSEKWI
jgi:hypothetical protein